MSIFSANKDIKKDELELVAEQATDFVDGSLSGLQSVLAESTQEAYQLQAGMYISDVLMEEAVFEGTSTPEVLIEGFLKNSWDRLVKIFEDLWKRVQGWFAAAKQSLQVLLLSGKKFVDKFGDAIKKKDAKDFKYEDFHYTVSTGTDKVSSSITILAKGLEEAVGFTIDETSMTVAGQRDQIAGANHKESYDLGQEKKDLLSKLGNEDLSEVLATVRASFRNGAKETSEIVGFSANSKEQMLALVTDSKTIVGELDKAYKALKSDFDRALTSIKKAKSVLTKDESNKPAKKAQVTAFANHKYQVAHFALTTMSSLHAAEVSSIKDASKAFQKVLKSFLSQKEAKVEDKKENVAKESAETSILESAMRFL